MIENVSTFVVTVIIYCDEVWLTFAINEKIGMSSKILMRVYSLSRVKIVLFFFNHKPIRLNFSSSFSHLFAIGVY